MPDKQKLSLWEHDGEYSIRLGPIELMSTHHKSSEERLGEVGCAHIRTKPKASVLIGGLGLGFTLRSVLSQVPKDASVVVADLVAQVIDWNLNPDYKLSADCLADSRVTTHLGDVVLLINQSTNRFDSILLDVDNGPEALVTAGNWRLYDRYGLGKLHGALRPGGKVAVWSAGPPGEFQSLMSSCGFKTDIHPVRSHKNSGSHHTIFLGTRIR